MLAALSPFPPQLTRFWPVLLLLVAPGACESLVPGDPVASVAVRSNRAMVPLGGPLDLSIEFVAARTLAPLNEDYRVMVHFLNAAGEMMWAADHEPATPTSQWYPGQTIAYTHSIRVPMYPYIGEAIVIVGLYSTTTGDRLELSGEHFGDRSYRGPVVSLLPQAESSRLMYADGWYNDEFDSEGDRRWRWTSGLATLAFRNPHADAVLYLEVAGRPDLFDAPQRVTLRIGSEFVEELVLDSGTPKLHEIPIRSAQFGDVDTVSLELRVDRTFVPAAMPEDGALDPRTLGVQVFYAFLDPH